jgi:hypothetical protein
MRIVHWLFVISVALFVSGIGFVFAAARTARQAPAAVAVSAPTLKPVASVKQIMKGITGPAATVVYNAVGQTMTAKGTEERAPHTDAEWEVVGNAAAALIETGNLLLMGSRAVDQGEWLKQSQALIEAGKEALKAVQAKNADGVFAAGEPINETCDSCHHQYQRGS